MKTKTDVWTSQGSEWWHDNIGNSDAGRWAQTKLNQSSVHANNLSDWLVDAESWGPWIPLSPVLSYYVDAGGEALGGWSKYVNDPKGAFVDDWESSGWLGQGMSVAGLLPSLRVLKKPADDLDGLTRKWFDVGHPRWKDDFADKAKRVDSDDPRTAAQAKLNKRANRLVERNGLDKPEDVWDRDKIRPTQRGFVVEAANDGNLPGGFKTWDRLDHTPDGRRVATSIKSMDPSLKSYASGSAVERKLTEYVDAVDGARFTRRAGIPIEPDDLDGRRLEVYVPPDAMTVEQWSQVDSVRKYAADKGIDLIVEAYP